MTDILTVTLNPCVDLSTSAPAVLPGPKLRCTEPVIDPGGGGINVSRAISNLGGQSQAIIAVAGSTGDQICALLQAEKITHIPFAMAGKSRQSLSVTDTQNGAQYRFVMPGPQWSKDDTLCLLAKLPDYAQQESIVVLSGSMPPGVADNLPQQIADTLAAKNIRLYIDTAGPALPALFQPHQNKPTLLRLDMLEAEQAAGGPLRTFKDSADFAQKSVLDGVADIIILARGDQGSVLATKNQRLFCKAAQVSVKSKTGAGDSFVGGFTLKMAEGQSLDIALQYGVAAASAAVMTDATALCIKDDVERLLSQCTLSDI
ncbi:1-phosphofructokinase family hexose kinase [Parasulfitobacter algicola]|uniref:Phosphofructokinase n=1 Tax=Parasulfitobacter algicola TaxID=2614809 RepID=A0ABX2IQF0_9RHOB|nr:1-phosphofructokinase family hexose kinase [Sulfitobacter algicola]NSX54590.1 1-phosphofructokinase family hexose kinase [Sulfitobacter algicola]